MKKDYQKALKKLTIFFISFHFNGQSYQKQKGPLELATSRSSGYKTSFGKFISYILSAQVWWYNIK